MKAHTKNSGQQRESNTFNSDEDFTSEEREYYKSKDAEQNRLSAPPEDVRVYFPAVWVFEAFTPSFIDNLKEGLVKAELVDKIKQFRRRDILEELYAMRFRSSGGSWFNIGHFTINDASQSRRLNLPGGIKSVSMYLHQFVPSTTILAVQFQFDELHSEELEKVLRKDFQTRTEKEGRLTKFHSPIEQKRDEYAYEKENLISICTHWMATNFPGLFQSDITEREHPVAELILLRNAIPIKKEGSNSYESFLTTIGFRSEFESYKSSDLQNIFMALNESILKKRSSLILSGNMDEILRGQESKMYGGGDLLFGITNWASTNFHKTLSFWCMSEISYTFDHKIKELRDRLGSINTIIPKQALNELRLLESEVSKFQINALPFLHEIGENINRRHFQTWIYDFKLMTDEIKQDKSLNELRRDWLQERAESIVKNNKQLDEISKRLSELISSQINLELSETNRRIQKWLFGLTIIAVSIAIFNFFDISWDSILDFLNE